MATTGSTRLLRRPDGPKRATLLELLFDVVYVAALALTSMRLAEDISWANAGKLLILLMAIWWTWSITALLTDFYDPQRRPIQVIIATTMLGTVTMAATLPLAFSTHGLIFAVAYVAIHVIRGVVLVTALRGHQVQSRAARFLFWFALSGVAWVAGALVPASGRAALWALALAIDYVAAGVRYPVPRVGRVPHEQYEKASEHIGERYQQFLILALGELVLVPTLRFANVEFTGARLAAFLVAFATTLLLWQIYVYRAGAFLQVAISRTPGRATRWSPYTQFVMVTGIVSTAAGYELVLDRPAGVTPGGWLPIIVGGPALFLIGRLVFEYQVFHRISWSRAYWLLLLVAVGPVLAFLSPLFVAVATSAILLGLAISDAIRTRLARPAPAER